MSDVRYENKRTRENVIEMERSINALSAAGEFELVTQSRKENKEKDSKTIPGQSSTGIILSDAEEEDTEITFAKVVITNTASSSEESDATNTSNSSQESDALNIRTCSKDSEETLTETRGEFSKNSQRKLFNEAAKIENKASGNRWQYICLIGDSLVGQLNAPLLCKSTNSFVRRLKAPKIQDVKQYTTETKDAKLIIIHSEINNLREKEETESCVKGIVEAAICLKEAVSQAKIAISKLLPIGDRDLNLESSLLNAQCEKKLLAYHNDVIFIYHSNLTEQER